MPLNTLNESDKENCPYEKTVSGPNLADKQVVAHESFVECSDVR